MCSSFLQLLIAACFAFQIASAIKCYQCNANEHAHCAEVFNPERLDISPTSCDHINEARYCIKATGIYEGTIGTRRFCSSRHHGNYCEYIRRPGDDREYRSCVFTCYDDGCNSATGHRVRDSFLIVGVLIVALMCRLLS
uniref:U37-Liphistoxin-Lsp1a_1 n=1 Tax=Liphistius sp. SGP-2016 TaxID=1905180 RepID=A0A4Q8K4J8_9ARAC